MINSDLSFELKLEQKIAVNCLLEGKDVLVRFFFSAVLHSNRTEEDLRSKVSEQCDPSYLPVDSPD